MKQKWTVVTLMPHLPASAAEHVFTVSASSPGLAAQRAFLVLRRHPKIKGRHIDEVTFTVRRCREIRGAA